MRVLIAAAALAGLAGCAVPNFAASPVSPADTATRERLFAGTLRDPGRAEVRDMRAYQGDDGTRMLCGAVNAPNGFGGMTGFQVFQIATVNGTARLYLDAFGASNCAGLGYRPRL